jgi:predicted RNase H-like nuclease (RuvC/YqgF family)
MSTDSTHKKHRHKKSKRRGQEEEEVVVEETRKKLVKKYTGKIQVYKRYIEAYEKELVALKARCQELERVNQDLLDSNTKLNNQLNTFYSKKESSLIRRTSERVLERKSFNATTAAAANAKISSRKSLGLGKSNHEILATLSAQVYRESIKMPLK